MSSLADEVLPLIRTRADVWRWSVANDHGHDMHEGVDILEAAVDVAAPAEVYSVTHKALASACTVIARADDSSGIIGDACRRLLELHPRVAAAAKVAPAKLVDWMIKFQFDGDVDYFELDPVAYAPALGRTGMTAYRARLESIAARRGPLPNDGERWTTDHSHESFMLDHNARRLAVHDHDIDAIIRTHARGGKIAAWLQDTARAFEEIGEIDLAIDWAQQAVDLGPGHQSLTAAGYWCQLLDEHRPTASLDAWLRVFRRWPSSSTAARLHDAVGTAWPDHHDEVMATLAASPADSVSFALTTLHDAELAWSLAHSLDLDDDGTWSTLINAYERIDPLVVLPIHQRLVARGLVRADPRNYRAAAQRLRKMRALTSETDRADEVDEFIAELRETHRRRPRLQQEFDRAGL